MADRQTDREARSLSQASDAQRAAECAHHEWDAPAFNLLGRQFRPNDKGFDGASGQPRRDDPVEFEAEDNEADPFGLDQFLSEAQKGKSNMLVSFTEGDHRPGLFQLDEYGGGM